MVVGFIIDWLVWFLSLNFFCGRCKTKIRGRFSCQFLAWHLARCWPAQRRVSSPVFICNYIKNRLWLMLGNEMVMVDCGGCAGVIIFSFGRMSSLLVYFRSWPASQQTEWLLTSRFGNVKQLLALRLNLVTVYWSLD